MSIKKSFHWALNLKYPLAFKYCCNIGLDRVISNFDVVLRALRLLYGFCLTWHISDLFECSLSLSDHLACLVGYSGWVNWQLYQLIIVVMLDLTRFNWASIYLYNLLTWNNVIIAASISDECWHCNILEIENMIIIDNLMVEIWSFKI